MRTEKTPGDFNIAEDALPAEISKLFDEAINLARAGKTDQVR